MRNSASLFLAGILLVASGAFAQHPAAGGEQPAQMPSMDCQSMMQEMQASSKAMDDRLQQLIDEMNKAKGSARVDRMAAVINELVTQRKQMREQMTTMMPKMMGHMTEHMKSGMMSGMSHSMAACPMMKAGEKAPEHKR
jgi:polyhydroxyalkanoate synthesis regulator phasin